MPHNNTTLNPANEKADWSLSALQTDIGAAANATLDTEHLISCTKTALSDTVASVQSSDGGVITASEVLNY